MITIDRSSSISLADQIARQIRYLIATGHYGPRNTLPSTRSLAASLGISFHTVRKAYQSLKEQGVVEATVGSGYRVRDPSPMSRSDRIERGAELLGDTLQQLVGLGLVESEIEYLVDEQLGLLETTATTLDVVFASSSLEIAEGIGQALARAIQSTVTARRLDDLSDLRRADYIIAEFRDVADMRRQLPQSDVLGVSLHIAADTLDPISRLLSSETLGLLTRDTESVRYLSHRIKRDTGFSGQIMATSATDDASNLRDFFGAVDLLSYTPGSAYRLRRLRRPELASVRIDLLPDDDSLQRILDALPVR